MPDLRFIEAASDPNLVAGIYDACDQWCSYCPATARCLAFRLSPPAKEARATTADMREAMRASMVFLKECHEAEGRRPPDELLRLLNESGKPVAAEPIDDPLEKLGRLYAIAATTFLASGEPIPLQIPKRPDGPTPYEVFLFYHVLIAAKIYRAITSARDAAATDARHDSNLAARVALLGIDRSDEALQVMALDDPDVRIDYLRRLLRRLRRGVEARFPDARATPRPGLE